MRLRHFEALQPVCRLAGRLPLPLASKLVVVEQADPASIGAPVLKDRSANGRERPQETALRKKADGVGFEPTRRLRGCRFSRPFPRSRRGH